MSAALLTEDGSTGHTELPDLEMVRDAAISIYNQYLSDKVNLNAGIFNVGVKQMELWEFEKQMCIPKRQKSQQAF